MDRPTDELAYPATDTRHRGHVGAGEPCRAAFRAEQDQRHQRRPGQSGGLGRLPGMSVLQIAYSVRSEAGALKLVLLASFHLRKFAEYHHKRLLAEKEVLLVDGKGTVLVAPSGGGWVEPVGTSIAGSDLLRF